MDEISIIAEGLGKRYSLKPRNFNSLRETLNDFMLMPVRKGLGSGQENGATGEYPHDFWALHKATFQVRHGEVLGIIGRKRVHTGAGYTRRRDP